MATADEDRIALRRSKALGLRIRGYTVREIGAELGISKSVAHEDVRVALGEAKQLSEDELQAERDLELHRIDSSLRVVAKILDGIRYESEEATGEELKLKAIDRQVKLQEQRAKLLGLYAPTKQEHRVAGVSLDDLGELKRSTGFAACPPSESEPRS